MTVITRFAPSPTGYLHIGGARTALFNWLYAKANGGKFLLRIEDTDKERSTKDAVQAILDGMHWLGLESDEPPVFQSERSTRHVEIANQLIELGKAFKCYVTPEELQARRYLGEEKRRLAKEATTRGNDGHAISLRLEADQLLAPFRSPYRDGAPAPSQDAPYVVRLKAPDCEVISFEDSVQGLVQVKSTAIDDLILLRSDGSPTYMLAVVVDDHDMGVTQIIRGDDHLANTYRQLPIYMGMEWTPPKFAHVPLIHGPDGKKLSKRHGALGIEAYKDLGYLPQGINNYLLRLGWSHGDEEIIPVEKAISLFNLEGLGKAAARLDFDKLDFVNSYYMGVEDPELLTDLLFERTEMLDVSLEARARIRTAMPNLRERAKTIAELVGQTQFLCDLRPIEITGKLKKKMNDEALTRLSELAKRFNALSVWENSHLSGEMAQYCEEAGIGMGMIGPSLRAALTGGYAAPDLGLVLEWLGKDEAMGRIEDQIHTRQIHTGA